MVDTALRTPADTPAPIEIGDLSRPLTPWERLSANALARRLLLLVLLAAAWEGYARHLGDDLLLPGCLQTLQALWLELRSGELPGRVAASMTLLAYGYGSGLALAALLSIFAVSTRIGADLLATLTAMFNPLPAIALLPLALLWFGLGTPSMVFVIGHSVLWAVSLNTFTGFRSVSPTLRMVGENAGLGSWRLVLAILAPAALPAIIAGLKIGWAFAWRTLIAAELVFGASSRSGGLGWFIFERRNQLETAGVFAGLLMVILIGLVVEGFFFRRLEVRTVERWGMQR